MPGAPIFSPESVPVTPDAEGKFNLVNLSSGKRKLELIGLDTSYYVKEVRYSGAVASDNIFTFSGGGALEIVLDDKPAVVSGIVSDGNHPVSEPYVLLSRWPAPPTKITGGEDGRFQFAGLAPGEYRIVAVAQTDIEKLDEPGVLDRLLANGEKLSLTPRASQNVAQLSDPTR